jgi:hypothetical protein
MKRHSNKGNVTMKKTTLVLVLLALSGLGNAASAKEWCAVVYGEGGRESCHFTSFQQCQASVSGRGGFCKPSQYNAEEPRRRLGPQTYGMGPNR